jgi:GAF domain-containing protein
MLLISGGGEIDMSEDNSSSELRLAEQLSRLIVSIQTSGRAVLPRTNLALLQSIVEAAARIFGAGAASIALVNEEKGTLEFRVAVGPGSDIVGLSIPLDRGIAGYVAMTGQPIAVSNVQTDPRFAQDFAKSTGYMPRSILATPLLSGDQVIGVMEVLDKISASSFGLQDMELLGMFAQQAALAIDQSRQFDRVGEALVLGLKRLVTGDLTSSSAEMLSALEKVNTSEPEAVDLLALADIFNQISQLGSTERKAAIKILSVFADYSGGSHKRRGEGSWR